ncbi:MAG: hypothetical protein AAB480_00730 [Patescibacteria group bacterium]
MDLGTNTGIVVITHNGRMPKDGGKRMGYMANGKIFPLPGITISLLRPSAPPKPTLVRQEICYADLPRSHNSDGDCVRCGTYPNRTILMMTDQGERKVVRCSDCGTLMKPRFT